MRASGIVILILGVTTWGCGGAPPASEPAPAAAAPASTVHADLAQLMRGILYPSANVIFAGQSIDPAQVKPADDPATATDPLASAYGGWTALENSGLALAESANLLTLPRKCANGRDVPLANADWPVFVQQLRVAGMSAFEAAKAKDQDKVLDAAGTVTEACAACHDKYREKTDRCS